MRTPVNGGNLLPLWSYVNKVFVAYLKILVVDFDLLAQGDHDPHCVGAAIV